MFKKPIQNCPGKKQGGKMSEELLQFPKHNTRGFRWPWGKSWCPGHLPAASLAVSSFAKEKAHERSSVQKRGWVGLGESCAQHRASTQKRGINSVCYDTKSRQQGCLSSHTGQPLALLPSHAMLLSDCKHSKDFHFQKYYINNSGIWNVLCIFKKKN